MSENNELENQNLDEQEQNGEQIPPENNDGEIPENNEEKELNSKEKTDESEKSDIYGAPEAYNYEAIKLPEGYEYDEDMLKEFNALNKETNLSQAQANKYMEFGLKLAQKSAGNVPDIIKQVYHAKVTQFQQALNTDKEIGGGDKAKMNAYLDVADKGYTAFANDEVKNALAEAGLNYHPAIIKMFHRIGELVGDDEVFAPKAPTGAPADNAAILYGN